MTHTYYNLSLSQSGDGSQNRNKIFLSFPFWHRVRRAAKENPLSDTPRKQSDYKTNGGNSMKRKIIVWVMAAAASMSLTIPAAAAPAKKAKAVKTANVTKSAKKAKTTKTAHYYADKDGNGICDNYADADKDGICDNCVWPAGSGCGWSFIDEDGDGICDYYQNGQCGRGMGYGQGRGRGCGRR